MREITLCALGVLLWSMSAWAEVQVFELPPVRFTVDVPDGWTAVDEGAAITLRADDAEASVSFAVGPLGEASLEEMVEAFMEQLKGRDLEVEDDVYMFSFRDLTGHGSFALIVDVDGENYMVMSLTGYDDVMEDIIDSLDFPDEGD